jgi:hypothetical protein
MMPLLEVPHWAAPEQNTTFFVWFMLVSIKDTSKLICLTAVLPNQHMGNI